MTLKTTLKVLGGIIATIVLGAVGSGIWERLLSPGLDWLFRLSIDLISLVSLNYKNGIYEAAAKGFHEDYSLRVFALTSLLFALFISLSAIRKHERIWLLFIGPMMKPKERVQFGAVIASVAFMYFIIYAVGRHEAINHITSYSMQSMEIVRPHIGEKNYLLLKSEYFQIKTAAQFELFNKSLMQDAQSNKVRLPDFEPL